MRESRLYGFVRGALSNERPYRVRLLLPRRMPPLFQFGAKTQNSGAVSQQKQRLDSCVVSPPSTFWKWCLGNTNPDSILGTLIAFGGASGPKALPDQARRRTPACLFR